MTNSFAAPFRQMRRPFGTLGSCVLLLGLLVAVSMPRARSDEREKNPLGPLPALPPAPDDNPATAEKVALGKLLFFDPRLSGDNKMSCATCHPSDKAFADGLARSPGRGGKPLARNTPGLLNSAYHATLFWDGRADSLEEQALAPIQSPEEMDQDLGELEAELAKVPGYVARFEAVFGGPPSRESIAKALAAFERTLITGPAPFDRYLAGDKRALSKSARRGLELFVGSAGCVRCHRGPLLSDGKLYRLGVASRDPGRAAVTGKKEDQGRFRTPSLRNVARTAPYMHDGSLATLEEVVTFYYRGVPPIGPGNLPLDVAPLLAQSFSEIDDLVAFLESLCGTPPEVTTPKLP